MSILSKNAKEAISLLNNNSLYIDYRIKLIEGLLLFDDAVDNDIDPMWGYSVTNGWRVFSWNGFIRNPHSTDDMDYCFSYQRFKDSIVRWVEGAYDHSKPELLPFGFTFGNETYDDALRILDDMGRDLRIRVSIGDTILDGLSSLNDRS